MKNTLVAIVCTFFINVLAAQQMLTYEQLAPKLATQSDTVFVVNFWATWCGPCVAELPHFEHLNQQYKDKKVKILLVSLDFKSQINTKLIPFLQEKKLSPEVVVLNEKDPNKWVAKVDTTWTGSIPATLIFDKNKRQFYERQFAGYEDLEAALAPFFK